MYRALIYLVAFFLLSVCHTDDDSVFSYFRQFHDDMLAHVRTDAGEYTEFFEGKHGRRKGRGLSTVSFNVFFTIVLNIVSIVLI